MKRHSRARLVYLHRSPFIGPNPWLQCPLPPFCLWKHMACPSIFLWQAWEENTLCSRNISSSFQQVSNFTLIAFRFDSVVGCWAPLGQGLPSVLHLHICRMIKQWKKHGHFLVVVQLIHRLTEADIRCTTTACLFFFHCLRMILNMCSRVQLFDHTSLLYFIFRR